MEYILERDSLSGELMIHSSFPPWVHLLKRLKIQCAPGREALLGVRERRASGGYLGASMVDWKLKELKIYG